MKEQKPMIPFGGQFADEHGLALLYVGGSVAWSLAKADRARGHQNILCLSKISHANQYRYPVKGMRVICQIYEYPEAHEVKLLNQMLWHEGAIRTAFWIAGMGTDENGQHPILEFRCKGDE